MILRLDRIEHSFFLFLTALLQCLESHCALEYKENFKNNSNSSASLLIFVTKNLYLLSFPTNNNKKKIEMLGYVIFCDLENVVR